MATIFPPADAFAAATLRPSAIVVLGLVGVGLLLLARRKVVGTTMLAPWAWLLAAVSATTLAELAAETGLSGTWAQPLRAAAAVGLVCPIVSSLGAKRPQSRAWQFVVLSLWLLLALPALRMLMLAPIANFHLPLALTILLLVLLAMGVADRILTRFGWAAVLVVAGAYALLSPFISWLPQPGGPWGSVLGLALICVGLGVALLAPRGSHRGLQPYDRLWLDARDAIGLLWSLRLAERFNTSAQAADWPVRLGWGGFAPVSSQHLSESGEMLPSIIIPREAGATFTALLRRFVTREWIAARLPGNV